MYTLCCTAKLAIDLRAWWCHWAIYAGQEEGGRIIRAARPHCDTGEKRVLTLLFLFLLVYPVQRRRAIEALEARAPPPLWRLWPEPT